MLLANLLPAVAEANPDLIDVHEDSIARGLHPGLQHGGVQGRVREVGAAVHRGEQGGAFLRGIAWKSKQIIHLHRGRLPGQPPVWPH